MFDTSDRKIQLAHLAEIAQAADAGSAWPAASWDVLRNLGGLTWAIPEAYGGAGRNLEAMLGEYERLAAACLTTCFILSQRDAAVRRIIDSGNRDLCNELLPPLARGESFATVGHFAAHHLAAGRPASADGARQWLYDHLQWRDALGDGSGARRPPDYGCRAR